MTAQPNLDPTKPLVNYDPPRDNGDGTASIVFRYRGRESIPAVGVVRLVTWIRARLLLPELYRAGYRQVDAANIDMEMQPRMVNDDYPSDTGFDVQFTVRASKDVPSISTEGPARLQ